MGVLDVVMAGSVSLPVCPWLLFRGLLQQQGFVVQDGQVADCVCVFVIFVNFCQVSVFP